MAFPRRFLPSISLLSAFEASARHQSFTAAADELNLTQSAVSRQVRALEEMLGSELFRREKATVRLTIAGQAYAQEIRDALRRISTATLGFRAHPHGGTLDLAILPTFGTRWLAPRLPAFFAEHPGITVNLTTRLAPFDFQRDTVDAAIHYGAPDWAGAELEPLMGETVIPACSPTMLERHRFRQPRDLLDAPLLHLLSRPDAWERWFRAKGVDPGGVQGMIFDQFATVAQIAMTGVGVALLPEFLIQSELERGDLVKALTEPFTSAERYYLACSPHRSSYPPLQAFRRWIAATARGSWSATPSAEGT